MEYYPDSKGSYLLEIDGCEREVRGSVSGLDLLKAGIMLPDNSISSSALALADRLSNQYRLVQKQRPLLRRSKRK
jgi:hypothetical protein